MASRSPFCVSLDVFMLNAERVKVNDALTKPFEVERGVKRGCPLSTALFA